MPAIMSGLTPFTRLWQTSNAPDYVGFLLVFAGWVAVGYVKPFHRMFYINDINISYPHAETERVSVPMNFVYALFIPFGVLILYNLLQRSSIRKHESSYLPLVISIALACFFTDLIKNFVGRPRPDLLARCQPAKGTKENVLVTIAVCTAPDGHTLQDGWRSFPSGHSTFAFAGLGFVSLFLAGQLRIFNFAAGGRDLGRALFCMVPILGALLIAISRCEDYRHDVYDISVGSLIGMTVAYWSYRRHWPKLTSSKCDEPYPPPGGADNDTWQRVRDVEQGQ